MDFPPLALHLHLKRASFDLREVAGELRGRVDEDAELFIVPLTSSGIAIRERRRCG
jgi:hypothetical protein